MVRDESKYDTGQLAAMNVMEREWDWHYEQGEHRSPGVYLDKKEAAAIADYALQFGKFPPAGISRNQRRHIRKNYNISANIQ